MGDWTTSLKLTFAEFRRRRVFRVAAVYVVASWVLIQFASATFDSIGLPAWSMCLLLVLLALGFLLTCVLAWVYDISPRGVERTAPSPHPGAAAAVAVAPAPGA